MNPLSLEGKVAFITGGGTGIGAATARLMAAMGADVMIGSRRSREGLDAVAADVRAIGRKATVALLDVREEASVEAWIDAGIAAHGRVDILVNNAGGSYLWPLEDTSVDKWDNNVALNLRGPFLLTRAVARTMIPNGGGAIVNILSTAARDGVRGGAAYAAAKAGLHMFTRVVASEWGRHGIRANAVSPGMISSEGALRSWDRAGIDLDRMAQATPLRRIGTPDDVAQAILFFASDAARHVSGECIAVDGGPRMEGLPD